MTYAANLLSRDIPQNSARKDRADNGKAKPSVRRAANWHDMVATATTDDVELVLWERDKHPPIIASENPSESAFEIFIGEQRDILSKFSKIFEVSEWPVSLYDIVEQDVQAFLDAFETKLEGSQYRLRLHAISDDACRRFHQDRIFQRLIITYRGQGTVWRYAANSAETKAMEMECVLLRGKRSGRDPKILHKSPIFAEGHPPRLVMVIDIIPKGFRP